MQKYVSHKIVRAAKIISVDYVPMENDGSHYELGLDGYPSKIVPEKFYARGGPHDDDLGYLVIYEDGYKSWTPTKPFEDGYTLLDEGEEQSSPTLADFNPSGSEVVAEIKRRTDELMNYITENVPENRQRSVAQTNYEQAAMWAVKANFMERGL